MSATVALRRSYEYTAAITLLCGELLAQVHTEYRRERDVAHVTHCLQQQQPISIHDDPRGATVSSAGPPPGPLCMDPVVLAQLYDPNALAELSNELERMDEHDYNVDHHVRDICNHTTYCNFRWSQRRHKLVTQHTEATALAAAAMATIEQPKRKKNKTT